MDKKTQQVVCLAFSNGRRHDFRLFKESKTMIHPETQACVDTGYQGLQKRHRKIQIPQKKRKNKPLTRQEKQKNREVAQKRVLNENVIRMLKRFKIVSDRYRNRRKRFALRFNLIAGIYNWELKN